MYLVTSLLLAFVLAYVFSLVMIAIMLPLTITSFKPVRKKMNAAAWKRIHQFAYVFFALIYIHIMVVYIPAIHKKWPSVLAYTLVFGIYFAVKVSSKVELKPAKQIKIAEGS